MFATSNGCLHACAASLCCINMKFLKNTYFFGLSMKAHKRLTDFREKRMGGIKKKTNGALSHLKNGMKKCFWWSHCRLPAGGQAPGREGGEKQQLAAYASSSLQRLCECNKSSLLNCYEEET